MEVLEDGDDDDEEEADKNKPQKTRSIFKAILGRHGRHGR